MPKKVAPKDTTRAAAYALWMKAPNPMVTFFKTFVEPEKTHFIEWERVGQGRHRPARSCLKIAIFPKSRAEENT